MATPNQLYNIPVEVVEDILHYVNPNRLHKTSEYSQHARWIVNGMDRARYIEKWLDSVNHYYYSYRITLNNMDYELNNYWYYKLTVNHMHTDMEISRIIDSIGVGKKQLYIDFSHTCVTDIHISKLKNVHSLAIYLCHNITDMAFKTGSSDILHTLVMIMIRSNNIYDMQPFCNVHTLKLIKCDGIKNVNMLGNVYKLYLSACGYIKDVSKLGNVHTLKLPEIGNNNLYSLGINNLGNVHTLIFPGTQVGVTVNKLNNVHTLDIQRCSIYIDISMLGSINILKLYYFHITNNITNERRLSSVKIDSLTLKF